MIESQLGMLGLYNSVSFYILSLTDTLTMHLSYTLSQLKAVGFILVTRNGPKFGAMKLSYVSPFKNNSIFVKGFCPSSLIGKTSNSEKGKRWFPTAKQSDWQEQNAKSQLRYCGWARPAGMIFKIQIVVASILLLCS